MWAWNLDPVWQSAANDMGIKTTVTTIEDHSPSWRRKAYDSFFCAPGAALAYQWTTESRYVTDLGATALPACLVVSNAAIDPLPHELKQILATASAKFMNRFNEVSEHLDHSLVGGLLERQGLMKVPVSPDFRAQFNEAALEAAKRRGADAARHRRLLESRREDAGRVSIGPSPGGRQAMIAARGECAVHGSAGRAGWALVQLFILAIPYTVSATRTHALRFATAAPDGTAWARLSRAFAREIDEQTRGELPIKRYFGGIAGNEAEIIARMRRGQLDGVASGGMLCQRLAPTMRVVHSPGCSKAARRRATPSAASSRASTTSSRPRASPISAKRASVATSCSRARRSAPSTTCASRACGSGISTTSTAPSCLRSGFSAPLPLEGALAALEKGELDGFIAIPTAALVFQWAARVRYYADLRVGYVLGCMVLANTALRSVADRGAAGGARGGRRG